MAAPQPPGAAPPAPPPPLTGPRPAVVWLFLAGFGFLFIWNSWDRDFWEPDEPRVALVARTMETGGGWITPSAGGEPRLDHPPLASWLAAASHRLTRLDPRVSYRIPAALAAVLGLALTWFAGRRFFDGRIGFLAAVLQVSTYLWFRRASWLDDDLYFAVAVEGAILSFALATRKGGRPRHALAGWAALALAALAKSALLALGLVVPPLVLFLFLEGGLAGAVRGFRRAVTLPGLGVFLLLAAPWYAAMTAIHGSAFLAAHFVDQHLGRIWSSRTDARPAWFYFLWILVAFLPWSFFLPLAFLHGKDRLRRDGERLTFLWALCGVILLTLASSKKIGYALALWPPLALLTSAAFYETKEWYSVWEDFLREGILRAAPRALKLPAVVVLAAAVLYLSGYGRSLAGARLEEVLADRGAVITCLAILAAAAGAAFAMSYRVERLVREGAVPKAAFETACAVLLLFTAAGFLQAGANAIRSPRFAAESLSAAAPAGAPLAMYGRRSPGLLYYLERPVAHFESADAKAPDDPHLRAIEEYLARPEEAFIIARREDLEGLAVQFPSLAARLHERATARVGLHEEYVLASNREK